jgi:hypothetical protein
MQITSLPVCNNLIRRPLFRNLLREFISAVARQQQGGRAAGDDDNNNNIVRAAAMNAGARRELHSHAATACAHFDYLLGGVRARARCNECNPRCTQGCTRLVSSCTKLTFSLPSRLLSSLMTRGGPFVCL